MAAKQSAAALSAAKGSELSAANGSLKRVPFDWRQSNDKL